MMGDEEEESTDDRPGAVSANPCSSLALPSFPSQSGEEVHMGLICLATRSNRGQHEALLTANETLAPENHLPVK